MSLQGDASYSTVARLDSDPELSVLYERTYTNMKILRVSAYYHDSTAALIVNGSIAAAAKEERFTRKKHDSRFARCAIDYCLQSQSPCTRARACFIAVLLYPLLIVPE